MYDESIVKYGNLNEWKKAIALFQLMPVAALIEDSVFTEHWTYMNVQGGVTKKLLDLDSIRSLDRNFKTLKYTIIKVWMYKLESTPLEELILGVPNTATFYRA